MNQLFESNVVNLGLVWVCLYIILKDPFMRAIGVYSEKLCRNRLNLEKTFTKSKQSFQMASVTSEESIRLEMFVDSLFNTFFLTDLSTFRFSNHSKRALTLSASSANSRLSDLLNRLSR